jgi:hypothetical protein
MPPTAEFGFLCSMIFCPSTPLYFMKDGALKILRDTLIPKLMSGAVRVALDT